MVDFEDTNDNTTEQAPSGEALEALKLARIGEILNPKGATLLVIDWQRDFVSPDGRFAQWGKDISPMQDAQPAIEDLIRVFRTLGRPIIFTRTSEAPDIRTKAQNDRYLFFEQNDPENVVCVDERGQELMLPTEEGDIVIDKTTSSVTNGTGIVEKLHELGTETVYVVGTKTDRCVKQSVGELYDDPEAGFHVVTVSDCIATDDAEAGAMAAKEIDRFYPPFIDSPAIVQHWERELGRDLSPTVE